MGYGSVTAPRADHTLAYSESDPKYYNIVIGYNHFLGREFINFYIVRAGRGADLFGSQ